MQVSSNWFCCIVRFKTYTFTFLFSAQGFYPYDFPNQGENGTGTVSGYIVAIGVGTVISFMIAQFVIFLRELIWSKIQKSGGWGSAKAAFVSDEAMILTRLGPGPEGEGGIRNDIADERSQTEGWRQRWPINTEAGI